MTTVFYLQNSLDKNKVGPILEQIYLSVESEKKAILLYCDNALSTCAINPFKKYGVCIVCKNNMKKIIHDFKLLERVEICLLSSFMKKKYVYDCKEKSTLSEYQELYYDNNNLDVGWAIVSSYVSYARDITNEISKKKQKRLFQNYKDAISLYDAIKCFIKTKKPDEFYIFNGRLFDARPVLRACQVSHVRCNVVEISGYKKSNWIIFLNTLPHDLVEYSRKIENVWELEKDEKKKHDLGEYFYLLKEKGGEVSDKSYTKCQNSELLPDGFDEKKKNIVIFNSSEDEVYSIGPEWKRFFRNQEEGVELICDMLNDCNDYMLYLRLHPNLKNVDSKHLKLYYEMGKKYSSLKIIPPDSKVSSYKLMSVADKVITFGSTMGIEATFKSIPSICLSSSFYLGVDGAYTIKFKNDPFLKEFLFNKYPPKNKMSAIKYGYYQMVGGTKYKYWDGEMFDMQSIPSMTFIEKVICRL